MLGGTEGVEKQTPQNAVSHGACPERACQTPDLQTPSVPGSHCVTTLDAAAVQRSPRYCGKHTSGPGNPRGRPGVKEGKGKQGQGYYSLYGSLCREACTTWDGHEGGGRVSSKALTSHTRLPCPPFLCPQPTPSQKRRSAVRS